MVSVGYRLAPEYPYPAAVNDCFDALVWVRKHCKAEWKADPDTIKLVGLSAYVGQPKSAYFTNRNLIAGAEILHWLSA